MTQEVTLRSAQPADYPALHALNRGAWFQSDYEEYPEATDAYVDLDLNSSLSNASMATVAEVDGQIAGVILASADSEPKYGRMIMQSTIDAAATIHAQGQEIADYFYDRMKIESEYDAQLLEKAQANTAYDGRIVLFIMDPNFQGLGIGSKLFQAAKDYFEAKNVANYYLFTDSSCNYPFYDHKGMHRAGNITYHQPGLFEPFDGSKSTEPFEFFIYDNQ